MSRRRLLTMMVWISILFMPISVGAQRPQGSRTPKRYVPGDFFVEFPEVRGQALNQTAAAAAESIHGSVVKTYSFIHYALIHVEDGGKRGWAQASQTLRARGDVGSVHPNHIIRGERVDPGFYYPTAQWYLKTIKADLAWKEGTGNSVVVAIIDSGIYYDHEDLAANTDGGLGWDFVDGDSDPRAEPLDPSASPLIFESHGTEVASIVGAVGDNGIGMCGVAPNVTLCYLRVLSGPYTAGKESDAVEAIKYAIDHEMRVINCSWGYYDEPADDSPLKLALEAAEKAKILVVASAGNKSTDEHHYPSGFDLPNIISVAACTSSLELSAYSNFGPTVDIAAPGDYIYCAEPSVDILGQVVSSYAPGVKGTSYAAPMVSGAAAIILSKNGDLSPMQIRELLMGNVTTSPGLSTRVESRGCLNVEAAVNAAPPELH